MSSAISFRPFDQLSQAIQNDRFLSFEQIHLIADLEASQMDRLVLRAAKRGHVQALRQLKILGANLNARDRKGNTPLHEAVVYTQRETMSLLHQMGVELDLPNQRGYTPLLFAYASGQTPLAERLISFGANTAARLPSGASLRSIAVTYCDFPFLKNLPPDPFADEFVLRKLMAHQIGVCIPSQLENHPVKLEGADSSIMLTILTSRCVEYTDSNFSSFKDDLTKAFNEAATKRPPEDLAAAIRSQNLVVIAAGWKEHAIALLFFDNYLLICNRGEGERPRDQTVMRYHIDSSRMTPDLVQKIYSMKDHSCAEGSRFFYVLLQRKLAWQKLPKTSPQYANVWQFALPLSKYGFCSFDSAEQAFRCAAALLTIKSKSQTLPSLHEDLEHFFSYLQVMALVEWIDAHFDGSVDFERFPEEKEAMDEELLKEALKELRTRLEQYPPKEGSLLYQCAKAVFFRCRQVTYSS
jgi:hypothetical protein